MLAQAEKGPVQAAALGFRRIDAVLHLSFGLGVAILLWVQFRDIGQQVIHLNVWVGLHMSGAARLSAIPDEYQRTWQVVH